MCQAKFAIFHCSFVHFIMLKLILFDLRLFCCHFRPLSLSPSRGPFSEMPLVRAVIKTIIGSKAQRSCFCEIAKRVFFPCDVYVFIFLQKYLRCYIHHKKLEFFFVETFRHRKWVSFFTFPIQNGKFIFKLHFFVSPPFMFALFPSSSDYYWALTMTMATTSIVAIPAVIF